MKYGVIEQMRQDYPVPPMCRLPGVSTSGYYAWRKRPPSSRAQQEPRLEAEILAHQRTRETFGVERMQKDLIEHGVQVGVHRIKRLRRKLGLRCKQKRKFKATTNSKHDLPVAPNRLNQDFSVSAPNQAWCGYDCIKRGLRHFAAKTQVDRTRFRMGQDRGTHAPGHGAWLEEGGPNVRVEHGGLQPRAHAFTGTSPPVVAEMAATSPEIGLRSSKMMLNPH